MDLVIAISVASVFAAGVFMITGAPLRIFRLKEERRLSPARLREAIIQIAAAAGKSVSGLRTARRHEQAAKEIYSALSVLRNHASASGPGESAHVTTDHILEQFAQTDGELKDIYAGALRLLRTGRRAEAAEYFTAAAGTPLARDFIMLVLDWDAVPPHKLKKTISAFQSALKEARTTELMKKNEVLSDLIYLPVIAGVLVIFVNFIYVAYFAEQSELLRELFF